jgi:hypothetical protein
MRALRPEPEEKASERLHGKVDELQDELNTCRARQQALSAYLEALDTGS